MYPRITKLLLIQTLFVLLSSWLPCMGCASFHCTATPYHPCFLFFSTERPDAGGSEEKTKGEIRHPSTCLANFVIQTLCVAIFLACLLGCNSFHCTGAPYHLASFCACLHQMYSIACAAGLARTPPPCCPFLETMAQRLPHRAMPLLRAPPQAGA